MNRLIFVAAITLGLSAPTWASAGDVGCVWRALPDSARAIALQRYAEGKADGLFTDVEPEVVGKAMVDCVSFPKSQRASDKVAETIGEALAAYVMQVGAEAKLAAALKIQPTALERAFGTIEPKHRRALADAYVKDKEGPKAMSEALVTAIVSAYPDADLEKMADETFNQFIVYFAGRAIRERAEAKF